jgi:hypothetical protein
VADLKKGSMIVQTGQPLSFVPAETDREQRASITTPLSKALMSTFAAYGKSVRELLQGKYKNIRELAPMYIQHQGSTAVFQCLDGILVRYDCPASEKPMVRFSVIDQRIADIAPALSDQFLHFPEDPNDFHPPADGLEISLRKSDLSGGSEELMKFRPFILASMKLPEGFELPPPTTRPPVLLSIQSELDLQVTGVIEPIEGAPKRTVPDVQQFLAHGQIKMQVGWQTIEIYPLLGEEYWKAEYAPMWAELDILASVTLNNLISSKFTALDGRREARAKATALLQELESLLSGPEEPVHQFLKAHPELISPTHEYQWSKLPFGANVSDFVFREPNNDYLLVEIEAPYRELFREDGQQRQELTHAINQISDWIQYICDNKTIVETNLGLTGISANPRSLVVIGRTTSLTEENRRKLTTLQALQPRLRILTYDDLIANARANLEHILGPLSLMAQNAELYYFRSPADAAQGFPL